MSQIKLSKNFFRSTVKLALNEDLYPSGDITSSLIDNNQIINRDTQNISPEKFIPSQILKSKFNKNRF